MDHHKPTSIPFELNNQNISRFQKSHLPFSSFYTFFKMLRFSSAILIAVVVCAVSGASIPAGNKLKFLGKFTSVTPARNGRQATTQTSFYFLSQNAAAWATANSDCKASLGDTASLVSIETPEELEEVRAELDGSDDTGSTYWTSGKFDAGKFVWEDGTEIDTSASWDAGHPNTRTPVTRVLVYRAGSLALRTDFQTVSLRYICELVV